MGGIAINPHHELRYKLLGIRYIAVLGYSAMHVLGLSQLQRIGLLLMVHLVYGSFLLRVAGVSQCAHRSQHATE
uniref:Uncharacterized protein n=1 Tax=Ciona savignyi TaxID=51511 RepID=H2YIU3_CIOSA